MAEDIGFGLLASGDGDQDRACQQRMPDGYRKIGR
jgi:hypothetical protein